jgi:purine-binding chemotaxis protein CheW
VTGSGSRVLVLEVESRACAVPLSHVVETMRPLPIDPIAGMPPFVRGLSVIRGAPTPVVDLGALLGTPARAAERFVTLRVGDRRVALSVGAVLGIRELDASTIPSLPPLLKNAEQGAVEAIGTLDAELLIILRAGWLLGGDVWQAIEPPKAGQ